MSSMALTPSESSCAHTRAHGDTHLPARPCQEYSLTCEPTCSSCCSQGLTKCRSARSKGQGTIMQGHVLLRAPPDSTLPPETPTCTMPARVGMLTRWHTASRNTPNWSAMNSHSPAALTETPAALPSAARARESRGGGTVSWCSRAWKAAPSHRAGTSRAIVRSSPTCRQALKHQTARTGAGLGQHCHSKGLAPLGLLCDPRPPGRSSQGKSQTAGRATTALPLNIIVNINARGSLCS